MFDRNSWLRAVIATPEMPELQRVAVAAHFPFIHDDGDIVTEVSEIARMACIDPARMKTARQRADELGYFHGERAVLPASSA